MTLYSSGYAFVKKKCNVSQTFVTNHSIIYIRQGDLTVRGNTGGPKHQQSIVTLLRDAQAAVLSQHLLEKSAPLATMFQGQSEYYGGNKPVGTLRGIQCV
jgi:hypothetical protein